MNPKLPTHSVTGAEGAYRPTKDQLAERINSPIVKRSLSVSMLAGVLLLTGCDYRDGYDACKKEAEGTWIPAAYNRGVADGKRMRYRAESCAYIGENGKPSVAAGVCAALWLCGFGAAFAVVCPIGIFLVKGVKDEYRNARAQINLKTVTAKRGANERAYLEARGKIDAIEKLQRAIRCISDKHLEIEIQRFVSDLRIVDDLKCELQLLRTSTEQVVAFINNGADLSKAEKVELLEELTSVVANEPTRPTQI